MTVFRADYLIHSLHTGKRGAVVGALLPVLLLSV